MKLNYYGLEIKTFGLENVWNFLSKCVNVYNHCSLCQHVSFTVRLQGSCITHLNIVMQLHTVLGILGLVY